MNPDEFIAASEAAESWLNAVASLVHQAQGGNVDEVFGLLLPSKGRCWNLQDSFQQHLPALEAAEAELRSYSDSPIVWEAGRGWSGVAHRPDCIYPHVWSTAHEAAAGIALLALQILADPVGNISDPAEQRDAAEELLHDKRSTTALQMTMTEVALYQERVRRESAKFVAAHSEPRPDGVVKDYAQPKGKYAKKGINARMLEEMERNRESHGWTSPEWARHLRCVKSSVVATPAWKRLEQTRDTVKAEKARDRRGRGVGRRRVDDA